MLQKWLMNVSKYYFYHEYIRLKLMTLNKTFCWHLWSNCERRCAEERSSLRIYQHKTHTTDQRSPVPDE